MIYDGEIYVRFMGEKPNLEDYLTATENPKKINYYTKERIKTMKTVTENQMTEVLKKAGKTVNIISDMAKDDDFQKFIVLSQNKNQYLAEKYSQEITVDILLLISIFIHEIESSKMIGWMVKVINLFLSFMETVINVISLFSNSIKNECLSISKLFPNTFKAAEELEEKWIKKIHEDLEEINASSYEANEIFNRLMTEFNGRFEAEVLSSTPKSVMIRCPYCKEFVIQKLHIELDDIINTCPNCGHTSKVN